MTRVIQAELYVRELKFEREQGSKISVVDVCLLIEEEIGFEVARKCMC